MQLNKFFVKFLGWFVVGFGVFLMIMAASMFFLEGETLVNIEEIYTGKLLPYYLSLGSIFIAIYPFSKENGDFSYLKHKMLGPYVPSSNFDNEIRRIELKRGCSVKRNLYRYTTDIKQSKRLLLQIQDKGYNPKIKYDYKRDCYVYSLETEDINIQGQTASESMAICIIYVELFD